MIGTIGWLILLWVTVGWCSVFIYSIADGIIKACILLIKGDEEGCDAVFDAGKDDETWYECLQDYYEAHPYIANHAWAKLFRWDGFLKVYLSSTGRAVNDLYNERLRLLKKKGESKS